MLFSLFGILLVLVLIAVVIMKSLKDAEPAGDAPNHPTLEQQAQTRRNNGRRTVLWGAIIGLLVLGGVTLAANIIIGQLRSGSDPAGQAERTTRLGIH